MKGMTGRGFSRWPVRCFRRGPRVRTKEEREAELDGRERAADSGRSSSKVAAGPSL